MSKTPTGMVLLVPGTLEAASSESNNNTKETKATTTTPITTTSTSQAAPPAPELPPQQEALGMTFTRTAHSPQQHQQSTGTGSAEVSRLKKELHDLQQRHMQLHHIVLNMMGKVMPMQEVAMAITAAAEAHPRV